MTDMIERAARAIEAAYWGDNPDAPADPHDNNWKNWRSEVTAVLQALREPTVSWYDRVEMVISEEDGVTLSMANGIMTIEPDTALKGGEHEN